MTDPLLAFALKLPLALLVFLVIAYAGTTDRRIAGVLFTFPILNGVAIIASPQPIVVADAIYPLVIFNCVLFALVISFPQALPPVSTLAARRETVRARGGVVARVARGRLPDHGFSRGDSRRVGSLRRAIDFRDPVHAVFLDEVT